MWSAPAPREAPSEEHDCAQDRLSQATPAVRRAAERARARRAVTGGENGASGAADRKLESGGAHLEARAGVDDVRPDHVAALELERDDPALGRRAREAGQRVVDG